jgi:AAA15 family ATPase/GTPase
MFISRFTVKNFRSIVNEQIELTELSAIVGQNDCRKSNVLRALKMFFNGHTDTGRQLNFSRDFSQQAKLLKRKAPEIEMSLELVPPGNYKDSDLVVWRKC